MIPSGEGIGHASTSGDRLAWVQAGQVHVRTLGSPEVQVGEGLRPDHIAMSPDARWLAVSGGSPFEVRLWECSQWKQIGAIPTSGRVRLAFTPDSASLIIGDANEYLFWGVTSSLPTAHISRYHTSTAYGKIAISPDGGMLALAKTRTLIGLYDYPALRELASLEAPSAPGLAFLTFDSTGEKLLVSSSMNQIQVWDLRKIRRELVTLGLDW
jgi:WD40 repeat protein